MKNKGLLYIATFILAACGAPEPDVGAAKTAAKSAAVVVARYETEGTSTDGANDPALLINPADPAESVILGSGDDGGIEVYTLTGERIAVGSQRATTLVDTRYNFPTAGGDVSLVVGYDVQDSELLAYTFNWESGQLTELAAAMPAEAEIEGLCLYQSPITHKFYAFAAGEGVLQQWEIYSSEDGVNGRLTRTVAVGPGVAHCVADDRNGLLYYSQETVGVARLNAEPESEAAVEFIDLAAPHGRFSGDIKGVALYEGADTNYLVVSDADVSLFQVYDAASAAHVGSFSVGDSDASDSVQESEGLTATSLALLPDLDGGLLVVTDDDNDDGNTNYKVIAWQDVAAALGLAATTAYDPRVGLPRSATVVSASAQTLPVQHFGDAADDPAIWVHPEDPALSLIIGTQKKRGINVYDMQGALRQEREDGRINNVDLRYGFMLDGKAIDLVTGSNRTDDSISVWKVDPETRQLVEIADGIIATGMDDPYGQCMYRSAASGNYYVFINSSDGVVKQWQLLDAGNGKVGAELVREFALESQTEGCVADDANGILYIGEEDVGIWKMSAEPDGGEQKRSVDNTETGNLTDDVEGLAIIYGPNGSGYLVASNQGADSYAVYDRQGDNRFLGLFHIVADGATGIDGVSETDGLDVTSANLGPAFPHGALVVQDGRNITPRERQNFKIVPWERIAEAMGLEVFDGYDPRASTE